MAKCPECGSDDTYIEDGPDMADLEEGIYLTRACSNCGAAWKEEYAIQLYDTEITEHGDHYNGELS